jgi:hypothetical protein
MKGMELTQMPLADNSLQPPACAGMNDSLLKVYHPRRHPLISKIKHRSCIAD